MSPDRTAEVLKTENDTGWGNRERPEEGTGRPSPGLKEAGTIISQCFSLKSHHHYCPLFGAQDLELLYTQKQLHKKKSFISKHKVWNIQLWPYGHLASQQANSSPSGCLSLVILWCALSSPIMLHSPATDFSWTHCTGPTVAHIPCWQAS